MMIFRRTTQILIFVCIYLFGFAVGGVLFEIGFGKNDDFTFFVKIDDLQKIMEARKILALEEPKVISGKIKTAKADFNPKWNFHFTPSTISFEKPSSADCDFSPKFIERNLNEIELGSIMPYRIWCPKQARLIREVSLQEEDDYEDL